MRFAFLTLFVAPFITAVVGAAVSPNEEGIAKRGCSPIGGYCSPGEPYMTCCEGLTCMASSTWTGQCEEYKQSNLASALLAGNERPPRNSDSWEDFQRTFGLSDVVAKLGTMKTADGKPIEVRGLLPCIQVTFTVQRISCPHYLDGVVRLIVRYFSAYGLTEELTKLDDKGRRKQYFRRILGQTQNACREAEGGGLNDLPNNGMGKASNPTTGAELVTASGEVVEMVGQMARVNGNWW
ncbi:hypothetical protein EDD15DRAFT_2199027 [Pisolithus albus]|nr:hypothetical protein EDD15DRAFT_2199027 [Pisolithus albus]